MGLRAAAKGVGLKDLVSGKIFKKNPFKTERGVKRSLGAIATTATKFGTAFRSDPQIQEARIEGIKAAIGEDVFDALFETKQVTTSYKRKENFTYTDVRLKKDIGPEGKAWIDEQIKVELEGKKGKKVIAVTNNKTGKAHLIEVQSDLRRLYEKTMSPDAYKEEIRKAVRKGFADLDESIYTETWEEHLKKNKVKYDGYDSVALEQAKTQFEEGKAAWEEKQIQKELSRRASQQLTNFKYKGAHEETEIDKIFKAVSEAFDRGLLEEDIYTTIHHTGFRPTYDEISELGALVETE